MEGVNYASDVFGNDPLAKTMDGYRIKPRQVALFSFCFFLVYIFALPAIFGTLYPREGLVRSSIVDTVNQVGFLFVHPLVAFYYLWQPGRILHLYSRVLVIAPKKAYKKLRQSALENHAGRIWVVLAFLLGGIVVAMGVLHNIENFGKYWYSTNWMMILLIQVSRFALFYMLGLIAARHLICTYSVNQFFKAIDLSVIVTRSEQAQTFNEISNFGLSFAGLGAGLGLLIAMRYLYATPVFPEDAIYLGLYFLVVPFGFFIPFWQAHVNMKIARDKTIEVFSEIVQAEYKKISRAIEQRSGKIPPVEKLNSAQTMLALAENAPVWPFETLSVYRLIATIVVPFILPAIGYLADIMSFVK